MTSSVISGLSELLHSLPPYQAVSPEERIGREPLPRNTQLQNGLYILHDEIGVGAFGIIYSATDTRLNQELAIKEFFPKECHRASGDLTPVPPPSWEEPEIEVLKQQFKEEFRVLQRFERPGIVKVYSLFQEGGGLFLVMEQLRGATLEDILKVHKRLNEEKALFVIRRLASTLETIHLSGLIHGDIKPENLFLTGKAEVILLDFGAVNHYLTQDRKAPRFLTPGYAPPEQYQTRRPPDPSSDLYALGATLYELLTGSPPPDALERLKGTRLPAPSSLGVEVTTETVAVLAKTLALAREKRPSSANELLKLLPGRNIDSIRTLPILDRAEPWVGHQQAIRRLRLTADGQFLASADKSGHLRLWSLPDERCVGVLEFDLEILDIAIHPTSEWMAVALIGGQVDLLDISTGRKVGTIRNGTPPVASLAFSPDKKFLLCGLSSGALEVWSLQKRRLHCTLRAHEAPINRIVFNPSGRLVALASNDRSASIWDLKTERRLREFSDFRRPVQSVSFAGKGQFLLTGGGEMALRLFDVRQGEQFRSLKGHEAMVWDTMILEQQELAISCSADRSLRVWDFQSFREVYRIQEAEGWLQTMTFDSTRNILFAAGIDAKIYRYHLNDDILQR